MNPWALPRKAVIEGREYPHVTDFRDILGIIRILNGAGHPGFRWLKALAAFFPGDIPPVPQGTRYLAEFLSCGEPEPAAPQPALIRWDRDAPEILEGVNAAAGFDVRERENLHWWTFVSLFHSIGEGRLAQLVSIRSKKLRGEKLTEQEQDYVRRYPEKFRPQESPEEKQERQRLEALLRGS